jgi:hypothetical protein
MPLQETSGNLTTDAFGGGVAVVPNYIEDVFSTWLYTGTGATQSINNGIDLSTKGGMVWIKRRNNVTNHAVIDTVRGRSSNIYTDGNYAEQISSAGTDLTSFNTNGFSIGTNNNDDINTSTGTYASWTFRKQPKFFDIVTYTGNGVAGRTIAHNLGSVPGCIIVKDLTTASDWRVYHRGLTSAAYGIQLNLTNAQSSNTYLWNSTAPTSTVFTVGDSTDTNGSGDSYVAYIFAHNAGGFGLTGTDNVISCGSYTGNGSTSGPTINLGYEPQWLLVKNATTVGNWFLMDNMRGIPMTGDTRILKANTSAAEDNNQGHAIELNATGFQVTTSFTGTNGSGDTLIYIAIRRGPMKVPTDATKVFAPAIYTGSGTNNFTTTVGFAADLAIWENRTKANYTESVFSDRLRSPQLILDSTATSAEADYSPYDYVTYNNTQLVGGSSSGTGFNNSGLPAVVWAFQRAPSFFDEVCYTGTGSAGLTVNHNLGIAPELIIIKSRSSGVAYWEVSTLFGATSYSRLFLNTNDATFATPTYGAGGVPLYAKPTSTTLQFGVNSYVNSSGATYVGYLFATCAGVSKVGSYTGNGTTQTINCGFTGGARFVLIKCTSATGDWYVYDTARGMTTLTDPYLLINSTAAETATLGSVTTVSTGFALNAAILAAINTSSATYIFLAIA